MIIIKSDYLPHCRTGGLRLRVCIRDLNKLEGCVTESDTFPVKGTDARRESRLVCLKYISGLSG